MKEPQARISAQAVGAYGEKAVEGELLRRGWIPSNVNTSVRNAAEYDIIAQKAGQLVCLRVKTCGAGQRAFQFAWPIGKTFTWDNLPPNDFTALVSMGATRNEDEFWVVPTAVLRQRLKASQAQYLEQLKRDGQPRKDTGQWTLWLDPMKSGEMRPSYGIAAAWTGHRDNWEFIDAQI